MSCDSKKIIVVEGSCHACTARAYHAHHSCFPEMHLEADSALGAVRRLVDRLTGDLDCVDDPSRCEAVREAIEDAEAFLAQHDALQAVH